MLVYRVSFGGKGGNTAALISLVVEVVLHIVIEVA